MKYAKETARTIQMGLNRDDLMEQLEGLSGHVQAFFSAIVLRFIGNDFMLDVITHMSKIVRIKYKILKCNYPFTPSDTFRPRSTLLSWDYLRDNSPFHPLTDLDAGKNLWVTGKKNTKAT